MQIKYNFFVSCHVTQYHEHVIDCCQQQVLTYRSFLPRLPLIFNSLMPDIRTVAHDNGRELQWWRQRSESVHEQQSGKVWSAVVDTQSVLIYFAFEDIDADVNAVCCLM